MQRCVIKTVCTLFIAFQHGTAYMEEQGGTHMEKEPIKRSPLRLRLGTAYYGTLRKLRWSIMRTHFARERTE